MLNKMRFRFIAVVLFAFLLVAGGLLTAVGVGSYAIILRDLNSVRETTGTEGAAVLGALESQVGSLTEASAARIAGTVARSVMGAVGVVAVLFLITLILLLIPLSKRAVAPYIRNLLAQKRFITDASHELKSPLTAISASADVLILDRPDDEWARGIKAECVQMSRMVSDLVTLCRLDEEQPFPDQTELSLSDVVWEIAEPMPALAKASGKTYSQSIEDGLTVKGDRAALLRMVSVLLDNALKYSDEHGRISLTLHRGRHGAVLSVFNTCGTAHIHDPDRLFDRFYRPDVSRASATGGTGIGLSIAKATAEAHGGKISAKVGDGGIAFMVHL